MKRSELKRARTFVEPFRITSGRKFRLRDIDPGDTGGLKSEDKAEAQELLRKPVRTQALLEAVARLCSRT